MNEQDTPWDEPIGQAKNFTQQQQHAEKNKEMFEQNVAATRCHRLGPKKWPIMLMSMQMSVEINNGKFVKRAPADQLIVNFTIHFPFH